jgi:hypothetical protein
MTIKFSTGLRNGMLNATGFTEAFDNGVMYIYSGSQPTSPDDAVQGTLLGIVTVDGGAFTPGSPTNGLGFDAPASGVLSKAAAESWEFDGITTGTAGWFRLMGNAADSLGASTTLPRMDGSIATYGADLNISNVSITASAPNTIDVFQLTFGES